MRRPPVQLTSSTRGMTLIELMVGLALGLFIAASGATLLAAQLRDHRALLAEARLMQDLRTAADLVSRDLRRAGYWGTAEAGLWSVGASAAAANPYAAFAPPGAASDGVAFRYSRDLVENDQVDVNEQFGYRLRAGAIEAQLGAGNWQALTDVSTVRITQFTLTPTMQDVDLRDLCAKPCPTPAGSCPPHQQVRRWALVVGGQQVGDAHVTRSVRSQMRVRADTVFGACPV